MKPVIKYNGGKSRELKIIKPYFPEFDTYVEPFVGGGSVFFNLEKKNSIINDLNPVLVAFYKDLAFNREQLIAELKMLDNTEECYYNVRDMFNEVVDSPFLKSTLFVYLNRTCFSGMSRYNSKGHMNVPFGRYKTYHPWDFLTEEASNLLKETNITSGNFEEIFNQYNSPEHFFYCDPPYLSPFRNYVPFAQFNEEEHVRLAEIFKESKAKIMINISDLGIIRELYEEYIVHEYDKTYAFNVKDRMRENNNVKHLIITNYKVEI